MDAFTLDNLLAQHRSSGTLYFEFLRRQSMSLGIYVIPAGGTDPQHPHAEDEVYYVIAGRGWITVDGEGREVQSGDIVFVGAEVEHRFHDVEDDLRLLVFFAPAESS